MYKTRVSITLIVVLCAPAHDLHIHKRWRQDIQRTELLMTFLVHRHGDRTPEKYGLQDSKHPEELMKLSEPYGLGQLDEAGKVRSYELGKFFRRRYDKFLSTNLSNVFIRCINSTRTILTATIAITAAYSDDKEWRDGMELMPFECEVVPTKYDYLSLGLPLNPVAQALLPQIAEGAKAAINVAFGNEDYVSLEAGVLLKKFFDKADQVIAGAVTPRMRLYSAHDFNVFSFVAVSGATPRQEVPDFCSVFALELRRVKKTGQYVVLPVYVSTPGEPEKYLQIEGCSGILCDFEEFRCLSTNNVINIHQYRKRCNFSEDIVVQPYVS